MSISWDELHKLSVVKRLELIELIWHSISDEPGCVRIREAERLELDRRLDELRSSAALLSTWDEVRARLERDE